MWPTGRDNEVKKVSLDFRLCLTLCFCAARNWLKTSKLLHRSLSITPINISISTTACKSLQIINASVLLAGTFASEMGDIINLVSDIINLEAEDSSANANQVLEVSRRWGWNRGYSRSQDSTNFISQAQMCMRTTDWVKRPWLRFRAVWFIMIFFPSIHTCMHTYRQCPLLPSICGEG